MKNWRTTLIGCLIGGLLQVLTLVQNGTLDAKTLTLGFGFAALGTLSKDFNVSGFVK